MIRTFLRRNQPERDTRPGLTGWGAFFVSGTNRLPMLENRRHPARMLDSDRDRAAGALFHILRATTKGGRCLPGQERLNSAFQARADAMLDEMEMDARAERYLWERQWG